MAASTVLPPSFDRRDSKDTGGEVGDDEDNVDDDEEEEVEAQGIVLPASLKTVEEALSVLTEIDAAFACSKRSEEKEGAPVGEYVKS